MSDHYSMLIRWSDDDQAFIVSLAEFGPYANTHVETRAKAFRMGCDALASLIETYQAQGKALPRPRKFGYGKAQMRKKKVRTS